MNYWYLYIAICGLLAYVSVSASSKTSSLFREVTAMFTATAAIALAIPFIPLAYLTSYLLKDGDGSSLD